MKDYSDILDGTVEEVKEKISDLDKPDFLALLKAEEEGQDRKTLKSYLEEHMGDEMAHSKNEKGEEIVEKSASVSEDGVSFNLSVPQALVSVFILGIAVGFVGGSISPLGAVQKTAESPSAAPSEDGAPSTVDLSKIDISNEPTLGSEDAEVTIVEYTDYQCPFCRRHATTTFPQIKEDYIDTGKVRYVVKDFPIPQLGHKMAIPLAKAANCADEQGMYWEAHRKLFEEQEKISPRGTAQFEESQIRTWMEDMGLNMQEYDQCVANIGEDEINEDRSEGSNFEAKVDGRSFITGTPSFVIYGEGDDRGEPLIGAQPYSAFKNKIDAELSE